MTEIYGTLGPACREQETLEKMFDAGMSGVRLNLSHVTLRQAERQIETLHKAAAKCGVKTGLVIDMQGPELRIGEMDEPVVLKKGETVCLGKKGIPVPKNLCRYMEPGQQLLLDDGKLALRVDRQENEAVYVQVLRGGALLSRKSIAMPGADVHPPAMTESDRENIRLAAGYGVTGVMQPFVRGREDLQALRRALAEAGAENIRLFAKIENREGLSKLSELIENCDEIVIARGDLGNAVPLWELPGVQKSISRACRKAGRAFMVVTQMLSSMEQNPVPTRAEVSDIFNAVLDGASSVMVTGETAAGRYPVEAISYLRRTAEAALAYRTAGNLPENDSRENLLY